MFVQSLAPDGAYRWTRTVGGSGADLTLGTTVSPSDTVVAVGHFGGTMDFDPGEGVDQHVSAGDIDVFVTRYTTEGRYLSTDTFGGIGNDAAYSVAVDAEESVVVVGRYISPSVDFDPTTGVDIHENQGRADLFITKLYCGSCQAVERHTVEGGKKKIISTVRALAPGGRVTVECAEVDPPGPPIRKTGGIDNDNAARLVFKRLRGGDYECRITEVKDASGDVLCDAPTGRRRVTVK